MNIFVTGAGGFIGQQLLAYLAADSRFEKIYCLWRRKTELPAPFITVHGSLEDLADLPIVDADVCIHLAAVTDSTVADGEDMFSVNADGTARVAEFCKRSNIGKIVFLSSVLVYLSEQYTYAKSKLAAEEHIRNAGMDFCILRCSLVYGKGCPSFGKILHFARVLHCVPVFGNGKALEQPVYMDEVCRTIVHHAVQRDNCGTFDLFGKNKMTYNEMVRQILSAAGCRAFLLHLPVFPFRFVARLCERHKLPFPVSPEQIAHICENLVFANQCPDATTAIALADFAENLGKYMPAR